MFFAKNATIYNLLTVYLLQYLRLLLYNKEKDAPKGVIT